MSTDFDHLVTTTVGDRPLTLDGTNIGYHRERVEAWARGERVAHLLAIEERLVRTDRARELPGQRLEPAAVEGDGASTQRVGVADLEKTLQGILKAAGHAEHVFGPPIHGVGIEFEEAPLPPGHAFFHGEKEAPPLPANVVIAVGNCGLYTGPWGVRVEDTNLVKPDGHETITSYPRFLEIQ